MIPPNRLLPGRTNQTKTSYLAVRLDPNSAPTRLRIELRGTAPISLFPCL